MHPLHADLTARMIMEQRHADAATNRRMRALDTTRPATRDRLGVALVRLGTRLQSHRAPLARPTTW